jgi:hypothetical protein
MNALENLMLEHDPIGMNRIMLQILLLSRNLTANGFHFAGLRSEPGYHAERLWESGR